MRHLRRHTADQREPRTVGAIVACPHPDCAQVAEIIAVWDWPSTTGFPAHARTRCLAGHVLVPPLDSIAPVADAHPRAPALVGADGRLARQQAR